MGKTGRKKISQAERGKGSPRAKKPRNLKHKLHRHKHHVPVAMIGVYVAVGALFILILGPTRAASSWTQTDWSGGVGSGTTNEYESASNIVDSTAGQISLDKEYKTAILKGTQVTGGSTNLNPSSKTEIQYNTSQSYDDDIFSYDGGSPTRLTVDEDGDYFISMTMPVFSNGGTDSANRNGNEFEIRVNGSKVDVGVGRSSYIRNYSGHNESSNHLGVLLEGLSSGDYVEIAVAANTSATQYTLTGTFTLYAEQITSSRTIFTATGTRTVASTNLNGSSASEIQWTESIKDSGFTHNDASDSQDITLDAAGDYFVAANIPVASSSQRANIRARVLLDGSQVDGGQFKQGYIRNYNSHNDSSIHWSGIVTSTGPNQVLSFDTVRESASGTVTVGSDVGTLYIEKLPSTGIYHGEATTNTGGSNWNPSSAQDALWTTDNIKDASIYTHSTSSDQEDITVLESGDYLLSLNFAESASLARSSPKFTVRVNGSDVTGAETKSNYIRNGSGHTEASSNLLIPLAGLDANDIVSVRVQQEALSGTVNDDTPLTLMLWKKGFYSSGTLVSNVFDATYPADWAVLNYTTSGGGNVSIKVRSDSSSDMSGATAWGSCSAVPEGGTLSDNACVDNEDQYLQYQVTMTPGAGSAPVLEELIFNYSASDTTPPTTNASNIQAYTASGGDQITTNAWTNDGDPYFTWDAGSDNPGGAGLGGYCVYLGTDDTADPKTTKGLLGTSPIDIGGACPFINDTTTLDLSSPGLLGTAMTSDTDAYYINIKAIDIAGNVFAGASAQFYFRFDNTEPSNPLFITAPSNFVSSKDVTLTWPTSGGSATDDSHSGVQGLQYRIGSGGTWYGDNHNGAEDETDLLTDDGSYTTVDPEDYDELVEGENVVYFRTWDNAGNVTTPLVTTVIKLNTISPSPPQNVTATPTTNTTNSFAFSWLAPASFSGSESNLTYCYTVNTLPSSTNCSFTGAGVTSLSADAYATQPGENTFYVVAKDEASNISYDAYGTATFTANTPAPGVSKNMEIADISVKATKNWKLAMSWEEPTNVGAGVDTYKVFRSTDGSSYSQVATTSSTSYVDQGLNKTRYYYKVKACDSANNCGAFSSVVDELPTGRFTEPAELITKPSVSNLSTRKATITWATERTSDSRVAFGTKSGVYSIDEVSNSNHVINHTINLKNLEPGTTYYYVAKWTDEDGNIGISSERSFTTSPAPSVKNVEVRRTTLNSAIIDFTSKEAVQVKLYFGQSEQFGGLETVNTSLSESSYVTELVGLDDGVTYLFKLNPIDVDGNEYEGTVLSFETPPRPEISNLRFQPVEGEPTSTQRVTWDTNVPTTSLVRYGIVDSSTQEIINSKLVTDHEVIIRDLADDSQYELVVESRDKDGNIALSDKQIFKTDEDTRPPELSEVYVEPSIRGNGSDSRGQVVVSWKTDEPATSQVAYGEGSSGDTYTNRTAEDTALVTEHVVIVSDLPTSSVYHLQPVSYDEAGNEGVGEDQSAIIGRASANVLDIIINTLQRILGF